MEMPVWSLSCRSRTTPRHGRLPTPVMNRAGYLVVKASQSLALCDESRVRIHLTPAANLVGTDCRVARRDSPLTMSKSCSDKIALKQCTSLLSGLTARFVSPENAYIDTLILPTSQYVEEACERCFGINGRMKLLADKVWSGGFSFRPFRIATTDELFRFSQDAVSQQTTACKGSNISAVWTNSICETLINGVLQGRKQDDPRGASQVSRSRMLDLFFEICDMEAIVLMSSYRQASYRQLKTAGAEAEARSHVKAEVIENALSGWVANAEDELGLPGKG